MKYKPNWLIAFSTHLVIEKTQKSTTCYYKQSFAVFNKADLRVVHLIRVYAYCRYEVSYDWFFCFKTDFALMFFGK